MSRIARRDVAPIIGVWRQFLLGRPLNNALRFEDGVSPRSQPPPNIPGGSADKLSANYYVNRDARREVKPPLNLNAQALIGDGQQAVASKMPTPGRVYHWD